MAYCERRKKRLQHLRRVYLGLSGASSGISDRRWRKIRALISSQVEEDIFSDGYELAIADYARSVKFRKLFKFQNSSAKKASESALIILQRLADKESCSEFREALFRYLRISPPRSTGYMFFKKIGGYESSKLLSKEEKLIIILKALIWKINKEGESPDVQYFKQNLFQKNRGDRSKNR